MKIAEILANSRSASRNRARSATPGVLCKRTNKFESINWENFLQNENSKIPLNSTPAPLEETDKKEYTTQLKLLKTQFNRSKLEWNSIEHAMNKTKLELNKIETSEKDVVNRINFLELRQAELLNREIKIKSQHRFAMIDFNTYLHIKERMTDTLIFLDIKANTLREQIKIRSEVLKEEERKKFRTVEGTGKHIRKFRNFSMSVVSDLKKRGLVAKQLDKEIETKQNFTTKREEMQKRRVEIIEAVANEDKNLRNNFLREGMLLHQAWFKYLNAKLKKETEKFQYIEQAYANIRSLTGMNDIHEVVQKILTKEHSYNSLMNMILESKKVCDGYQARNEELEQGMNEIIMQDKHLNAFSPDSQKKVAAKLLKKIGGAKEREIKINGVKLYVISWAKSFIRKINPNEDLDGAGLNKCFQKLKGLIKNKAKFIRPIHDLKFDFEIPVTDNRVRKEKISDNLKSSELVFTEDEFSEGLSPTDKGFKKKNTIKKY